MLGCHDDTNHGGAETQVPEVEGQERKEATSATGMEEVKDARQPQGSIHIPLLALLHCSLLHHVCRLQLALCVE